MKTDIQILNLLLLIYSPFLYVLIDYAFSETASSLILLVTKK